MNTTAMRISPPETRLTLFVVAVFFLCTTIPSLKAQQTVYPFELPAYPFICYDTNRFEGVRNNLRFADLYNKFNQLITKGNNRIHVVHIGGSHIQADIYTHRIRQDLQTFYPGYLGSRGYFFPYTLANTNSPSNLSIQYTGYWQTYKNTKTGHSVSMGLSGFTAVLSDSSGTIRLVARYDSLNPYDFTRVRLFCNAAESGTCPSFLPLNAVDSIRKCPELGFVEYSLHSALDTLNLVVTQPASGVPFELYGIDLQNDDPGVTYSAIGVNGATLSSYLRCNLLSTHLRALQPDWIIISIGTNEGNSKQFDEAGYLANYRQLLNVIAEATPMAALLLTVPNDAYLFRRYSNTNIRRMRELIFSLAEEQGCGVWDFYSVMGGLNSAREWYNSGLMNRDHIHFNKPGYLLKGDLLFNAFLNSWEDHLPEIDTFSHEEARTGLGDNPARYQKYESDSPQP